MLKIRKIEKCWTVRSKIAVTDVMIMAVASLTSGKIRSRIQNKQVRFAMAFC